MTDQSTQLVLEKLDEIIGLAGGKIGQFYPFVVRQQYVEALIGIAGLVLVSFATVFSAFFISKYWDKIASRDCEPIILLPIVLGALSIAFGAVSLVEWIPQLMNPHFYAVRDVLGMVKP